MAEADCCQTEIKEVPKPAAGPGEPDHSGAEAKAHEFNREKDKAKAEAEKDGKKVTDNGPKPTSISIAKAPKAQAKPGEAAPAGKTAAKSGEAPTGHGKGASGGKGAAPGPAPAKGPAAMAAAASVDAEVQQFLEKAPHDPSKEAIHPQVKQLVEAAQTLQEKAGPFPSEPLANPGLLKVLTDPITKNFAFGDDVKMMEGPDQNPYKNWNPELKSKAEFVSRTRDVLAASSSILGKIGFILSLAGVIISITGIGAPLAVPLATIGKALGLLTLVMDGITAALSGYLVYLGGMQLKKETDPKKRAAIAKQIMADADKTFQATMSMAMAIPGVGKLAGAAAGGLKTLAKGIAAKLAKVLGKVALPMIKGLAKGMAFVVKKGKGVLGIAEKAAVAGERGMVSRALGAAGKGLERGAAYTMYGIRKAGQGVQKFNSKLEKGLEKFGKEIGKTKIGKAAGKVGSFVNAATESLEKFSGVPALERAENSIRYGFAKVGAKVDRQVARLAGGGIEKEAGKELAETTEKHAAQAAEKSAVDSGEKAAAAEGDRDVAEAATERAASTPEKVGTASEELQKLKEWGGDTWNRKGAIAKDEEKEAEHLAKHEKSALKEEAEKRREVRELEKEIERKNVERRRLAKKGGDTSALDEQISDGEKELAEKREAAREAMQETEEVRSKMAEARAAERANQRLNEARGGRDSLGREAEGLSHTARKGSSEWQDAKAFEDPRLHTMYGVTHEELFEKREAKATVKEVMEEEHEEKEREELGERQEQNEEARNEAGEAVAKVEEYKEENEGGDPSGAPGAAPEISELQGGAGGEGVAARVHNLLGDLAPAPPAQEQDEEGQPQVAEPQEPASSAPAGQAVAPPANDPHGGEDGAPSGAPTPKAKELTGKGEAGGAPAQPGAVPYWPALLKEYDADLKDLDQTEAALHAYRAAQISGYKRAVGIEDGVKKGKETAGSHRGVQEHNIAESNSDTPALEEASAQGKEASGHAAKGGEKKGEGASGAQEGGAAASVEVPDPPAEHWWNKLINLAKKYLVNYLAKGLKWVQDKFSNAILKLFVGVDLESMKKIADCRSDKAKADAGVTTKAAADTQASKAKDEHTEQKAEGFESEAKQLQIQTKENVKTADELLHAVADLKKMIVQERTSGEQFMKDLTASKEQEKKDQEAKEQREQAKQEQQGGDRKKHEEDAATKARERQAHQEKQKAEPGNKQDKKHEADPFQVARVKQAANLVIDAETTCHDRIVKGFLSAKQTLAAGKGQVKLDPERVEAAAQLFEESAQETVSQHADAGRTRTEKMKAIISRDSFAPGDPAEVGAEVEETASEGEQDFASSVEQIKLSFEACYKQGFTPARRAPAASAPAPAAAAP